MDIDPAPDGTLPEAPNGNEKMNANDDPNQSLSLSESVGSSSSWDSYQSVVRKSISEMIILNELSINFVDGIGFRHFMAAACPEFQVPSKWTIARDCYQIYADEKIKLKQFLKTSSVRVSLTIDTWTSSENVNYLCLTAHYLDKEWKLNRKLLNFCPVSSHSGEAMGILIEKCLRDWKIDRVFAVVVDSVSSNDVAISYLKKTLNNLGTCIQEGKYLHLRYIADRLNLVVIDGLKEMDESVSRIRGAVRYIKQSPSRLVKFKECALIENIQSKSMLCLDVSTRWDSTYLMLDAAQKFEKAFEAFGDVDLDYKSELMMGDGLPEKKDWENTRRLCLFLQKLYELTIKVSRSSGVTSNNVIDEICFVYSTFLGWQTNSDVELSVMAKRMKDKFDQYLGNVEKINILLYIAPILDPRKKLEFVRFCFMKMYSPEQASVMIEHVKEAIEGLFSEYKKMWQSQNEEVDESSQEENLFSRFKRYKKAIAKEDKRSELEKYLSEEYPEDYDDFDVLAWWNLHASRFPILSDLARDVFAAPISKVTSESAFSIDGRVLDEDKSSLTPKLIEALICIQDWRRESPCSDDIKEDLEELERVEMDLSKMELETSIDD